MYASCIQCACTTDLSYAKNSSIINVFKNSLSSIDVEEIIKTYNLKNFTIIKNNNLYTNIHNASNYNKTSIIATLNKILLYQDALFKIKSKSYSILLIDNHNFNKAQGVADREYIIIEGNFEKNAKDYIRTVSHELIHRYIGHIIQQNQENEVEYKWFFEGFTEFFGVRILLDSNLINKDEYLEIVNTTLREYFSSLITEINFKRINKEHYLLDQSIQMLSYNKGFILAMIIDETLKKFTNKKHSLVDVVNTLISKITSEQINFDVNLLAYHLMYYLPKSFVTEFINSINDAKILITLLPNQLIDKKLSLKSVNRYGGICFNLTKSIEQQKICGVKLNSSCYTLGLRNGQRLECYSIHFDSGDIKLKVLERSKVYKVIEFNATKTENIIPLYE